MTLFAVTLFLGIAAPADAGFLDPKACRENCKMVEQGCRDTAKSDRSDCMDLCSDRDCRRICKATFENDTDNCKETRERCAASCIPDIDNGCANSCIDDKFVCQADARACPGDCQGQLRDAVDFCKVLFNGGGQEFAKTKTRSKGSRSETLDQCITAAYDDARECRDQCPPRSECGKGGRRCLKGCVGIIDD